MATLADAATRAGAPTQQDPRRTSTGTIDGVVDLSIELEQKLVSPSKDQKRTGDTDGDPIVLGDSPPDGEF